MRAQWLPGRASPPPLTYADAEKYRACGYAVAPVAWGESSPPGAWARYQILNYGEIYNDWGVAAFCYMPPAQHVGGITLNDARATWLAALRVSARTKKLAAEIDTVIAKHVAGRPPVRHDSDGGRLWPFALGGEAFQRMATRCYSIPGEKVKPYESRPNFADVISAGECIVLSGNDADGVPYTWKHGDLTTCRRDQLPTLNATVAAALIRELEDCFDRHGAVWG
jgi:hypothetical protein